MSYKTDSAFRNKCYSLFESLIEIKNSLEKLEAERILDEFKDVLFLADERKKSSDKNIDDEIRQNLKEYFKLINKDSIEENRKIKIFDFLVLSYY